MPTFPWRLAAPIALALPLFGLVSGFLLGPARARAEARPRITQTVRVAGVEVDVVVGRGSRGANVQIQTPTGHRTVYTGRAGFAFAAGGDEGVLLALVGAGSGLEAAFVPIQDGQPGPAEPVAIPRVGDADGSPVGASIATVPGGFAVFWQEASGSAPGRPLRTFLARTDDRGRPLGPAVAVPAPWPIADVAWMPSRGDFYFLLFYSAGGDTRLAGVHVDGDTLRPMEHPWWASRPGAIDEARLAVIGERVFAVYRDGSRLFEADVSEGAWGREVPAPQPRGPIRVDQTIVVVPGAEGLEVRTRYPR